MDDDFFAEFDADIQVATANAKDVTDEPTITSSAATTSSSATTTDQFHNASAKRAKVNAGTVAPPVTKSIANSNAHNTAKVPSKSDSASSRKRSRDEVPTASNSNDSTSWKAPYVNPEYIRVKLSQAGEIVPSIGPAMPPHLMQPKKRQSQPVAGPQAKSSGKEKATAAPFESAPNFQTPNARSLAYLRGLTPGQAAIVESQQSAYTYNPSAAGRIAATAAAESAIQAAAAAAQASAAATSEAAESVAKPDTVRYAGGKVWEDNTLAEWPDNDYRIFVGNLGIECSDELLLSVFKDYPSAKRAKVVKEKKTRKVKGFGFVSFMDPFEMVRALKQMNGKYCGSRPMQVRKSDWQKRSLGNAQQEKKAWRKKHGL